MTPLGLVLCASVTAAGFIVCAFTKRNGSPWSEVLALGLGFILFAGAVAIYPKTMIWVAVMLATIGVALDLFGRRGVS